MSFVTKMLQPFETSGVPLYIPHEGIKRQWPDTTTGVDLLQMIEAAERQVQRLQFTIREMTAVVDGETLAEMQQRIKDEDANPEPAARAGGYMPEADLKALLIEQGEPFGQWLRDKTPFHTEGKEVVRLRRDGPLPRNSRPERYQYAPDYLHFASDWTDALAQSRKRAAEELNQARNEALK